MKVLGYEEKEKQKTNEKCLYRRFGSGVHLIKSKDFGNFKIMIIHAYHTDALFIEENNCTTHLKSRHNERGIPGIEYEGFDDNYKYIKKLNSKELIVDLKALRY